jgi:hypothetical protein
MHAACSHAAWGGKGVLVGSAGAGSVWAALRGRHPAAPAQAPAQPPKRCPAPACSGCGRACPGGSSGVAWSCLSLYAAGLQGHPLTPLTPDSPPRTSVSRPSLPAILKRWRPRRQRRGPARWRSRRACSTSCPRRGGCRPSRPRACSSRYGRARRAHELERPVWPGLRSCRDLSAIWPGARRGAPRRPTCDSPGPRSAWSTSTRRRVREHAMGHPTIAAPCMPCRCIAMDQAARLHAGHPTHPQAPCRRWRRGTR